VDGRAVGPTLAGADASGGVRFTPGQADEVIAAIGDALADAELTVDELTEAIAGRTGRGPSSGRWRRSREVPNPQKLAILMAMSMTEQMSLADVKNRLSEVVDRLQKEHGRVVITKHGHPAAVVISLDDLESLEETLDVMDSVALLDDIREALADRDAQVLSKEDALRLIAGR
jgi:antitoxin YefM